MNKGFHFTLAFILVLGEACPQVLLQGRIVEYETNNPVSFASIGITGSSIGTASDENGAFILKVESEFDDGSIVVSSIGYINSSLSIDSLKGLSGSAITISLRPFAQYLGEVIVKGKRLDPEELLKEAIAAIPENYSQKPFNLEFYSRMEVKDSLVTAYQLETILLTYRKGYVQEAVNWSRILQKREQGTSPLKPAYSKRQKRSYFSYFPGFDISVIDQIGVGPGGRYTVFNPRKFDNMEFAYAGISVFDKDTVSIINYSSRKKDLERMSEENGGRYSGVIYIAVNNLAIVRHTLRIRSSELDIIYKNFGGQYFPYSLRTEHPIYSDKSKYLLLQTISLRNIKRENVEVVENLPQHWFVEDVAFNEGYWDANYPVDR